MADQLLRPRRENAAFAIGGNILLTAHKVTRLFSGIGCTASPSAVEGNYTVAVKLPYGLTSLASDTVCVCMHVCTYIHT